MIFESEIIINPKYKKYELLRDVLLMIVVVVGVPAYASGGGSSNRKAWREDMAQNPEMLYYMYTILTLIVIYSVVHYFTRKYKIIGRLEVFRDGIKVALIKNSSQVNHTISELKKVVIIRGSTFHKIDGGEFVEPYKGNNRLELHTASGEIVKHEFLINNVDHNLLFEKMIKRVVKEWRGKVLYKSI